MVVKRVKVDPNTTYPYSVEDNDPAKRGKPAGPATILGRYTVYPVHSSFAVVWFVDEGAENVRTEPTFALAIKGLKI